MNITTDVLVCGGGCAGLVAALSAARDDARVLLVERAGFAGGIITCVGLPFFDGVADYFTKDVVTPGLPVELLSRMGQCEPGAKRLPKHNPRIRSIEGFKRLADELILAEAPRLKVLYHSFACDVRTRGARIDTVRVANKNGLVDISASVVIDCTGDGDIAAWAGAPTEKILPLQPMTLHFRVGNVQLPEGLAKLQSRAEQQCLSAHKAGELPMFYGPGISMAFAEDEAYFHAIRVAADGTDAEELTRAEIQGRRDVWTIFQRLKRNVPGFEQSYLVASGPYIGIRETRRIVGEYVLTEDDIRHCRRFDDAVATGCWYLDVHPQKATPGSAQEEKGFQPKPYDIPLRSLLPTQPENLLVAGRCHSATKAASSSTRVNATAMAMGQAAGVAAALAVRSGTYLRDHPGTTVREILDARGIGPYG